MPIQLTSISSFITTNQIAGGLRAAVIILIGFWFAKMAAKLIDRICHRIGSPHYAPLWSRITFYSLLIIFTLSAFSELGFDLHVLLGAAGILTIGIGFTAQTSLSNLISGLLLMFERPFVLGETIVVGNTTGDVLSVDLLSTKLRTPDNTLIRIPNEILIKTQITNLTRFTTRRFDCLLTVSFAENLSQVKKVLMELADKSPLCLKDPPPSLFILHFSDAGINIQFSVWSTQQDFNDLKNSIYQTIQMAFEKEGIALFPSKKTVYLKQE